MKQELKIYKALSISEINQKNAMYCIKGSSDSEFTIVITDSSGIPVYQKDNTGGGGGSVNSVTGTAVTGTSTNTIINIATFLSSEIGNLLSISTQDNKLFVEPITSPNNSISINGTQLQLATALQNLINSAVQPGDLADVATSGNYSDLNNIPTTFTPSVHTHVEADITDLDKYTQLEVDNLLNDKQDELVSGTNIKTINGNSVLGSGDLPISGGGEILTITWDASEFYNGDRILTGGSTNFLTQPGGSGWNNTMSVNIGNDPLTTGQKVGIVLPPFNYKLKSATLLITNSASTSADYELRVFAHNATLSGSINEQIILSNRPQVGVVTTMPTIERVISFDVGTQPVLPPNTIITHALANRGDGANSNASILYTFEKV